MARMMSLRLLSKCIITCQCPDETPFLFEEATGNFEDIYLEIDYILAFFGTDNLGSKKITFFVIVAIDFRHHRLE